MTVLDTKVSIAFVDCSIVDSITLLMSNSSLTMFKTPVCLCKKGSNSSNSLMGHIYITRLFEVLSVDFLKLDHSNHGYQKVLVAMDGFIKYAFAFPTKNELGNTVAELLVNNIFNVFSIPHKLHSDHSRNFKSDVIAQLCNLYGIKKIFTCPYSPQSNALPECFNQTIINMVGT